MPVDMSQFHGVFFDECVEHFTQMEHLLMALSLDNPDNEDLNSIFRAAHSIKGGSGVFGFDALTGLTHVMESILDLARKHDLALTKPIVDQLLLTVDTLSQILVCYKNQQAIDWAAIELGTTQLMHFLNNNASSNNSPQNDQGFGFFEHPAIDNNNEDFGFFETVEQVGEQSDDLQAQSNNRDVQDSPEAKATHDLIDEDFGFFENVSPPQVPRAVDTLPLLPQKPLPKPSVHKERLSINPSASKSKSSERVKSQSKETGSIRVDTLKIDALVNLVGELVITQSMIKIVGKEVHGTSDEKLDGAIVELSRNIREIQEAVMSMRMLPMSFAFNRFPRVVRDLADKLNKDIELTIKGGATEIDKGLIEKLVDPLTHLIRNSIDHGIETPAARIHAGKPAQGSVVLNAEQRGGSVIITISDDGTGLDRERILQKAVENGLAVDKNMSDDQVWLLIFEAGFSTANTLTDLSGRGVGMDVVRRNIESIGGTVEIESKRGQGSLFRIRLPLTLAIVDGMCVSVGAQTFVVPLINVIESMQPSQEQLKTVQNDHLLWVRGEYWPLVRLFQMMEIEDAQADPSNAIVVLVETSRKRFGILVDALKGQQQVVIKSLEKHYKRVPGVAGATIMGDGSVAMILDIESIASHVNNIMPQEVPIAS